MHLMMTISMIIMSLMMIVMMKSLMILTQKIQAVTSTSCQVRSSDSYFLTPFSLHTFDEDNHDYHSMIAMFIIVAAMLMLMQIPTLWKCLLIMRGMEYDTIMIL